jgi:methionyl-tRNA formyltransferase
VGQVVGVGGLPAAPPGALVPLKRRLLVCCGGATSLEILELQLEGRKRMDAAAFLNGRRLSENEQLGR